MNLTGATLRSVERPWLPFVTSGVSVALNTLLNYGLIYGRLGLPAMGLKGAALATVVALWVHALLLWALTRACGTVLAAPLRTLAAWNRAFVLRFYRIVTPVVGNEVLWAVGTNIYAMVLARQGSENYAAYTIFSSVEQLSFVLFAGVCSACAIMVGKAIGGGRVDLGWKWSGRFLWLMVALGLVCGALMITLRWPMVRLLSIETAYTESVTASLLLIYGLWAAFRVIPYIAIVGIFRGGGDTRTGFYIDCVNVFLLGVPVTCLLGLVWHAPFPMLVLGMYVAEDTVKIILCLLHYRSGKWIRRLTAGTEPPGEPEGGACVHESGI